MAQVRHRPCRQKSLGERANSGGRADSISLRLGKL